MSIIDVIKSYFKDNDQEKIEKVELVNSTRIAQDAFSKVKENVESGKFIKDTFSHLKDPKVKDAIANMKAYNAQVNSFLEIPTIPEGHEINRVIEKTPDGRFSSKYFLCPEMTHTWNLYGVYLEELGHKIEWEYGMASLPEDLYESCSRIENLEALVCELYGLNKIELLAAKESAYTNRDPESFKVVDKYRLSCLEFVESVIIPPAKVFERLQEIENEETARYAGEFGR